MGWFQTKSQFAETLKQVNLNLQMNFTIQSQEASNNKLEEICGFTSSSKISSHKCPKVQSFQSTSV